MTPQTPENILRHELIRLPVRVVGTTDPTLATVQGTVIDETKNLLVIITERGRIRVAKKGVTFRFTLRDSTQIDIDGHRLVARPEDRLKTRRTRH